MASTLHRAEKSEFSTASGNGCRLYRRSYNCNGRYYCLHELSRYDRQGLWSWGTAHFSVDGSLKDTVRRMVCEAEAGCTHRELELVLRVRVHNTLLDLWRDGELAREPVAHLYVYLHKEQGIRRAQIECRKERVEAGRTMIAGPQLEVSDGVVIQVLLVLIRHPGSEAADVVRYLRGHVPPIPFEQVRAVFRRYDLDDVGEKGGPTSHSDGCGNTRCGPAGRRRRSRVL